MWSLRPQEEAKIEDALTIIRKRWEDRKFVLTREQVGPTSPKLTIINQVNIKKNLNRIILVQHKSDNNYRIIQLTNAFCVLLRYNGASNVNSYFYRVFHIFREAKFPDGGLHLGSSQFSILPQLPPNTVKLKIGQNWPKKNHLSSLI